MSTKQSRIWMVLGVICTTVIMLAIVAVVAQPDTTTNPDIDSVQEVVQEVAAVSVAGNALQVLEDMNNDSAVGTLAPNVTGESFDGSPVSIIPGDGNRYMVVFLAHWCPHCQAEVPRLVEWFNAGTAPNDLRVVAVSAAVNEAQPNYPPSAWLFREQWPQRAWPVLLDDAAGSTMTAFGHAGFPFFVLIDGDGTVVHRHAGELGRSEIEALVASAFKS